MDSKITGSMNACFDLLVANKVESLCLRPLLLRKNIPKTDSSNRFDIN